MAKAVKSRFILLFFFLVYAELRTRSVGALPDPQALLSYSEALIQPGCELTSSEFLQVKPVSLASSGYSNGDIFFIRRQIPESEFIQRTVQSVVFTSGCNRKAEPLPIVAESEGFTSRLISQFFQTVLAIPSMIDQGQDFNFIWRLMARLSDTDSLELFYSLPDITPYPVVLYRGHWVEVPALLKGGSLWFPEWSGDGLVPGRRLVLPLSASVTSILGDVVSAVDFKQNNPQPAPDLKCAMDNDNICEFVSGFQEVFTPVNQQAFLLQDASFVIPLAGFDNMSALHIARSGQLGLVNLQWMMNQLDFMQLNYFPCAECARRFDAIVKRRYTSSINFARFIGLFTCQNPADQQAQGWLEQLLQVGPGPGGPDDFPMLSVDGHDLIFPGEIPSGRQAGSQKKQKAGNKKKGGTSKGAANVQGAGNGQPSAREKRVRFFDEDDEDEEKDPDKRRSEIDQERKNLRDKLKDKIDQGYVRIQKAAKNLVEDMNQELEHLKQKLKRTDADTPSAIAKENERQLSKWSFVIKTGEGGEKSELPVTEIKGEDVIDLDVQQEALEEEYVVEPETGTMLADGKRRISVITPEDIAKIRLSPPAEEAVEALPGEVFEQDIIFDGDTAKLMASGRRRASSIAHGHVEVLRGRLNSLLAEEKDIREMTRKEISAASKKIDQLLDDELTLRYEELDRLDQGRARLAGEITRKKDELDRLHSIWFENWNEESRQAESELRNLQLKAQEVCEEYAALHSYDTRYRHWADSLVRKQFDQEAYQRLEELDQAREKVLGSFRVAYFGRHWKNLASPKVAHPRLAFLKNGDTGPGARTESFYKTHTTGIAITLTGVLTSLGVYYCFDELYELYRRFLGEHPDGKEEI